MIRISTLGAAFVALALITGAGCDSPQVARNDAREAQREASQKAAEARREAEEIAANAQARADEEARRAERAVIQAKNELRSRIEKELNDLGARIDEIDVRASKAQWQTKAELEAKSRRLQDYRAALRRDLEALERTTSADFESAKARIDASLKDLQKALDDASPRI